MASQGAILDSQTELSNSEFLCCADASNQVSAQSKLQCGRICHLKNFKMATNVSWISEQNNFSNSESLCCCDASHQVLAYGFGRCRLKNFKMAATAAILDIRMEQC